MSGGIYWESWRDIKNNLILLIPQFLSIIILTIIALFILYFTGLLSLFNIMSASKFLASQGIKFDKGMIISKFILPFILIFIAILFIDSYFTAMKLGMITELIRKRKTTLRNGFSSGKNNYLKVLKLTFLIFLIIAIPLLMLALLFFLEPNWGSGIGLLLIGILYLIYISLAMFFVYPIMFLDKINPSAAIKKSFRYFRKKIGCVLLTVITILLTSIVVGGIERVLALIPMFGGLIGLIISSVLVVWADLYKFKVYSKNKIR